MTESADYQLIKIRIALLDLIKSFFHKEPDANRLSLWRGVVYSLSKETISIEMDQAIRELSNRLQEAGLEQLQDEYYELFVNPFSKHKLNLNASFYRDGHNFGNTLVACRDFLKKAGIEKRGGVADPEDSLVIMLDIYQELILMEKKDRHRAAELEAEFLNGFLFPLAEAVEKNLYRNDYASFYKACSRFLSAYLAMERSLTFGPSRLQSVVLTK